ncbi:adenosylcobalamin-dependent ribonucleoside-diphosphate reductase [Candidatus Pacearchaeota archaeon]|nr:adenosylcobalamin-dependent ribonucleoside-diphosphate reductase [Candidatus Pacearchaeota archaeon]
MPEEFLDYKTALGMRIELSKYARDNMNISSNARFVFENVYMRSLENGEREDVSDRMAAIAVDIASAEMKYLPKDMPYEKKIEAVKDRALKNLELYVSNDFRANTPTNLNMGRWVAKYNEDGDLAGRYSQAKQLGSACFVIPIEDTFGRDVSNLEDGILEAWVTQQLVHKGGGGTGFSFQRLRPKGSIIGYNPAVDGMHSISWDGRRGVSSGFESFLESYYNASTEAVKQGNSRRGANMGIQRIDHMDFLDHMFAKFGRDVERSEWRIKNFNLSLAVTDEFMEAAEKGHTYTLFNPHRARPEIKRVLEKKFGIENPEVVRKQDIATREQFESIINRNSENLFAPLTTPNMYLDDDGTTVINAYTGDAIGTVVDDIVRIETRKVLGLFAKLSHSNGEPGMIFIDRINENNAVLFDREIESTNPCGEQPLPPYAACNLASINVGNFARYGVFDSENKINLEKKVIDNKFTKIEKRKDGKIGVMYYDWDTLRERVNEGVRFLDNVVDRSDFPADKVNKAVSELRNIGLGYMGVWDAMVLLKMRYGSGESYEFAEELAKVLHDDSLVASKKLAEERGEFPLWKKSAHNPDSDLYQWITSNPRAIPDRFRGGRRLSDIVDRENGMRWGEGKVRNVARITQAPTGTIRRSAGHKDEKLNLDNLAISSGIEPIFSIIEQSNILNAKIEDWSSAAVKILEREGLDVKEIMEAIRKNKGSVSIYGYTGQEVAKTLEKIPENVRNVLVTAAGGEGNYYEITPEQHARMLIAFQKYNDSATSKTINLPESATPEDIREAWMNLWKLGAKGGTIYRDASRSFQILNRIELSKPEGRSKIRRPLVQNAIAFEFPYLSSNPRQGIGDEDFDPDRCFTTITYNPVNKGVTGIFQNISDVDAERISLLTDLNRDKSRAFKQGRSIDEVIEDLEKINIGGNITGIVVDEAVMPEGSKERKRFEVRGSTTREAALNSLYVMKFLTDGGKSFNPDFMKERLDAYYLGKITLKTIVNTKGKVKLEEDAGGRPSILSNGKVVKLPDEISGIDCPECM